MIWLFLLSSAFATDWNAPGQITLLAAPACAVVYLLPVAVLAQLAFHGGLDLLLEAASDLETGPHHTAEDSALALGAALDRALGDRGGIARYGDAVVPMDDALARASIDLGGRPWCECAIEHDPGLAAHMFQSLTQSGRLGLHVEATGRDPHHVAEAAFKAVGRALRAAVRREGVGIPSTKGIV